jgi:hypothetical protein
MAVPFGQPDQQVRQYSRHVPGSLQARGRWFEPTCAHQVNLVTDLQSDTGVVTQVQPSSQPIPSPSLSSP